VENFRPVYDWFKDSLVLIAPDSRLAPFDRYYFDKENILYQAINDFLPQLDLGITSFDKKKVDPDSISFPKFMADKLLQELNDGQTACSVGIGSNYGKLLITRQGNKLNFEILVAVHQKSDGTEVKFDINQESNGTQRILDLLPAFINPSPELSKKVYVIDEIDRCLHTLLTRLLIEEFLDSSSDKSRAQLLFTTHDHLLMDKNLLRLDEMWLTERDSDGATALFSIAEFPEAKGDKSILKSYLTGRMGGIPNVFIGTLHPISAEPPKLKVKTDVA
jgi:hypothetical protein